MPRTEVGGNAVTDDVLQGRFVRMCQVADGEDGAASGIAGLTSA